MNEPNVKNIIKDLGFDNDTISQILERLRELSDSEIDDFLTALLGPTDGSKVANVYRGRGIDKSVEGSNNSHAPRESSPLHLGAPSRQHVNTSWRPGSVGTTKKKQREQEHGKKSQKQSENKIKLENLANIDAALAELELTVANKEPRRACDCMGTRHGLLEIAPNCLSCGKIICVKEGLGPCLYCGEPLLTEAQLVAIGQALTAEKEDITSTMGRKALQQASRTQGEFISSNLEKAESRLNKLLQFQAEQAQRTRIIDQVSDFDIPSAGVNQWASPMEQAKQLKKQQMQLRKLDEARKARSGRGKIVMSVDIKGNKVVWDQKHAEPEISSESEDEPVDTTTESASDSQRQRKYDLESLNQKLVQPTYKQHIKMPKIKREAVTKLEVSDDEINEDRVLEL